MDHLEKLMDNNAHIDRPEYTLDVIRSVTKFWSVLNEQDKDYLQCAESALHEGTPWRWYYSQSLLPYFCGSWSGVETK